jgi:hypothetical protein
MQVSNKGINRVRAQRANNAWGAAPLLASVTLIALTALLLPAVSLASGSAPSLPEGVQYLHTEEVTLPASNGYRVTISGHPGGRVRLLVQRPNEEIEYLARGRVTPMSIKASFGQLGNVSLRFHPSGGVRRIRKGKACPAFRPSMVEAQLGTFEGTVGFRGEGGYTEVVGGRASGDPGARLTHKLKFECKASSDATNPTYSVNLIAADSTPKGFLEFAASTSPVPAALSRSGSPYSFLFFESEKTEGMSILRTITASAPAKDFIFDSAFKSATVTPPSPFTGKASYQHNPDGSGTWSGTLAVPVSGLGVVPLVGPTFQSRLNEGVLVHQNEVR